MCLRNGCIKTDIKQHFLSCYTAECAEYSIYSFVDICSVFMFCFLVVIRLIKIQNWKLVHWPFTLIVFWRFFFVIVLLLPAGVWDNKWKFKEILIIAVEQDRYKLRRFNGWSQVSRVVSSPAELTPVAPVKVLMLLPLGIRRFSCTTNRPKLSFISQALFLGNY